ncbi:MAG: hypothetical protein AAFY76_17440, partial [Cyanobacteria bacterium J06649_11]
QVEPGNNKLEDARQSLENCIPKLNLEVTAADKKKANKKENIKKIGNSTYYIPVISYPASTYKT